MRKHPYEAFLLYVVFPASAETGRTSGRFRPGEDKPGRSTMERRHGSDEKSISLRSLNIPGIPLFPPPSAGKPGFLPPQKACAANLRPGSRAFLPQYAFYTAYPG